MKIVSYCLKVIVSVKYKTDQANYSYPVSYWQGFCKHLCISRSESIHKLKLFLKRGVTLFFELLSFPKALDQGKCKFVVVWVFFLLLSAFDLITGVLVYEEHT